MKYYSKAIRSPLGQKVRAFYTTTSKQVMDIHEEARRIASQKTQGKEGAASSAVNVPEFVESKADTT